MEQRPPLRRPQSRHDRPNCTRVAPLLPPRCISSRVTGDALLARAARALSRPKDALIFQCT